MPVDSEHPSSRRVVITMVHGTYGRGFFPDKCWGLFPRRKPIWSERGSSFRALLCRHLKRKGFAYELKHFHWPGDNSVAVRDFAAQALADQLDQQSRDDPTATQVVIGHSHGGTIALNFALHYCCVQGELLVVTLATPFLDFEKVPDAGSGYRNALKRFKVASFAWLLTLLLVGVLVSTGVVGWENLILGVIRGGWHAWASLAILFFPFFFLAFVEGAGRRMGGYSDYVLAESLQQPDCSASAHRAVRLLVLRGFDDEATLVLMAGAIQHAMTSRVFNLVIWAMFASMGLTAVVGLYGTLTDAEPARDLLLFGVVFGLVFLGYALVVLGGIGQAAFGREFLLGGTEYHVNSSSAPDFAGGITIRTLHGRAGVTVTGHPIGEPPDVASGRPGRKRRTNPLRHSLYDHEDCVEQIVTWLDQRC